jgi:hypothetical protein
MKTLIAFAAAAAIGLTAIAAQAMPVAPNKASGGMVIQVAGGCGLGWHRGPYGGCRRNGFAEPLVVAPAPYYNGPALLVAPGPCGGRGQHRVCNGYGRCWMVCN